MEEAFQANEQARALIRNLMGGGFPQILLRLGYPVDEIPPSPRRAIEEALEPT